MRSFFVLLLTLFAGSICSFEKEPYLILAIDGGGIRGIIPATVLSMVEEKVGAKCGQLFDCMSGTSTGGILAVGLAKPDLKNPAMPENSAKDLLDLYLNRNSEIFYRPFMYKLKSVWGYVGPKYSNEGLKKILEEELGDMTIDKSVCDIVIPAYDLTTQNAFHFEYFKSDAATDVPFKSVDAVLSSTAAPTYFSSYPVKNVEKPELVHNLIDGGIIANNPAEFVLMECLRHARLEGREIYLLSVGTGMTAQESIPYRETKDWGILEYLNPLIDELFDASALLVDDHLKFLASRGILHFLRVNIEIPKSVAAMDNTAEENVAKLHEYGIKCFKDNFEEKEAGRNFLNLLKERVKK